MKRKHAECTTIRNATPEELREVILLQLSKLGLESGKIKPETKQILVRWLRSTWGNISLADFSDAFNMAINGTLEIDAKPYGNFSVQYVGRVLSAWFNYQKLAGKLRTNVDRERSPLRYEWNPDNVTDMSEQIRSWVNELKRKKTYYDDRPTTNGSQV